MINILFPLNKFVVPDYKYWVSFLNGIQKKLYKDGISITYLLSSENLVGSIESKIIINGEIQTNHHLSIEELESKYKFSLQELLYVDYLQTSQYVKKSLDRNWYIPESEFRADVMICNKLNQIVDIFNNEKYDLFVFPKNKYIRFILTFIFIAPMTLLGIVLSKILPCNNNFYLDNIIVAKKPSITN